MDRETLCNAMVDSMAEIPSCNDTVSSNICKRRSLTSQSTHGQVLEIASCSCVMISLPSPCQLYKFHTKSSVVPRPRASWYMVSNDSAQVSPCPRCSTHSQYADLDFAMTIRAFAASSGSSTSLSRSALTLEQGNYSKLWIIK